MMNLNCQMVLILFHIFKINKYIIEKHETLTTICPIHAYINRINTRLVFKINDGYKLELQRPETVKLFGRTTTTTTATTTTTKNRRKRTKP